MLRENYNNVGLIKEYKNGNITIKLYLDNIGEFEKDEILELSELFFQLDCYFIGDTYCLSNYETGHTVYNTYSDLVYIFPWSALEDLKAGKTIKLYALKPDETDREWMEKEGF